MSECLAELCVDWTGDGCACDVFGLEPVCGCGCHEMPSWQVVIHSVPCCDRYTPVWGDDE